MKHFCPSPYYRWPVPTLGRYLIILVLLLGLSALSAKADGTGIDQERVPLKVALTKIAQDHQIHLNYNAEQVEKLSVKASVANTEYDNPETALQELLKPVGLNYKKIGKIDYVIRTADKPKAEQPTTPNNLLASTGSTILRITVNGTVVDDQSEPIPGVNVLEKGTTNGTITDVEGKFNLNVEGESSVLVFSSIGYVTQELPVGNTANFSITLETDTRQLSEVVVTALGISREQK
ncbi:MAG: carboxypeptidase-like regulatory domain-containing protein, partial [Cyclobacteriaceae bacterium]